MASEEEGLRLGCVLDNGIAPGPPGKSHRFHHKPVMSAALSRKLYRTAHVHTSAGIKIFMQQGTIESCTGEESRSKIAHFYLPTLLASFQGRSKEEDDQNRGICDDRGEQPYFKF